MFARWIFCLSLLALTPMAHASVVSYIGSKQAKKEATRWTLAEWLEQKKNIRLMDYWLAANTTPNPLEFYVSGSYVQQTDPNGANDPLLTSGTLGFFYSIVGLEGRWNQIDTVDLSWQAALHLRLLGEAEQSSRLSVFYGLREQKNSTQLFSNPLWGARLSLYLFRWLGIEGEYRSYLEAEANSGDKLSESQSQGGVFIEYHALRLYSHWYNNEATTTSSGTPTVVETKGLIYGLKFFF